MNLLYFLLTSILVLQSGHLSFTGFVPSVPVNKDHSSTLSCVDFIPKNNFDMKKFLGIWQIMEFYTERGDPISNCMGVEITEASINGTYVTDIFIRSNGKIKSLLKQYVRNIQNDGYLDVLTGSLEADQDYTILETNYKSALLLTCKDINFDGVTDLIEIDFLSRGIELSDKTYQDYIEILQSYGIVGEFVPVEQEYCP